jgi:hypothetical protein
LEGGPRRGPPSCSKLIPAAVAAFRFAVARFRVVHLDPSEADFVVDLLLMLFGGLRHDDLFLDARFLADDRLLRGLAHFDLALAQEIALVEVGRLDPLVDRPPLDVDSFSSPTGMEAASTSLLIGQVHSQLE